MWESPVNIMEIQEPIIEQFIKEREEMVLKQIWKIGIDVNKEELSGKAEQEMNYYRELSKEDASCEVFADSHEKEYEAYCKAIKIVNQLAEKYNNDFCEWEKIVIDSMELVREPHRMYLFKTSDDEWEFCPYCGKKIKIAPYQPKGE